jgi:hypothetical protein
MHVHLVVPDVESAVEGSSELFGDLHCDLRAVFDQDGEFVPPIRARVSPARTLACIRAPTLRNSSSLAA